METNADVLFAVHQWIQEILGKNIYLFCKISQVGWGLNGQNMLMHCLNSISGSEKLFITNTPWPD